MMGVTAKPSRAKRMAGAATSARGSCPKRRFKATQPATAPGTVTASQPRSGIAGRPVKRSGVQAAGDRPDEFRPCSA